MTRTPALPVATHTERHPGHTSMHACTPPALSWPGHKYQLPDTGIEHQLLGSGTGTNFLIRAVAFREAGWSPEYTLTEDYALGMELTRLRWHCRYVSEYLAIGEAPHETRNCFQQRSRWCKVPLSDPSWFVAVGGPG